MITSGSASPHESIVTAGSIGVPSAGSGCGQAPIAGCGWSASWPYASAAVISGYGSERSGVPRCPSA